MCFWISKIITLNHSLAYIEVKVTSLQGNLKCNHFALSWDLKDFVKVFTLLRGVFLIATPCSCLSKTRQEAASTSPPQVERQCWISKLQEPGNISKRAESPSVYWSCKFKNQYQHKVKLLKVERNKPFSLVLEH